MDPVDQIKEYLRIKPKPPETSLSSENAEVLVDPSQFETGPFSGTGLGCGNIDEPLPEFIQADCEVVLKNRNNAYIVLGRDRPGGRTSGKAGVPFAYNTGMIDLVVGRGGPNPRSKDESGETCWVDPNFTLDAARIYISQTSDVDRYFGISTKAEKLLPTAPDSNNKSGIGIKADHVRLIGREQVKIVTYSDYFNSKNQSLQVKGRISLIANNDDESLQPMVLGNSLRDCLALLINDVRTVKDVIYAFQKYQDEFNKVVSTHTHLSNYWGESVKDSAETKEKGFKTQLDLFNYIASSCKAIESNLTNLEVTHLGSRGTKSSILSSYCFAN
jgi:hypothetical protein